MTRLLRLALLLLPIAAAPVEGLRVGHAGTAAPFDPAGLPARTARIALHSGRGQEAAAWSGPLLWQVLVAAHALDPTQPAAAVHGLVRVTGADGYVAVLSLGEISPDFAGRAVLLALRRDGAPLARPRLVVPDERRGGRSVRDVISIEVE